MVHARVLGDYIHFELMYMADHIFPVLTIKDLINEDGYPTTPLKLAKGKKKFNIAFRCLIVHMLYKNILHMLGQSVTKRKRVCMVSFL